MKTVLPDEAIAQVVAEYQEQLDSSIIRGSFKANEQGIAAMKQALELASALFGPVWYITPERVEALQIALSDWEMEIGIDKARVYAELPQRAHSLTGALRDMLAEATS